MNHFSFFCVIFVVLASLANVFGYISQTIIYSVDDLIFSKGTDGFDLVSLPDAVVAGNNGDPQIPSIPVHLVIPPEAILERVEVIELKTIVLNGTFKIGPVKDYFQLSEHIKQTNVVFNEEVYSSSELFPKRNVILSIGSMCGSKIVGLKYFPIKYNPLEGKLQLTTCAEIRVHFKNSSQILSSISECQYAVCEPLLNKMVNNSEDMKKCRPPTRADKKNDVNYAIITDATLVSGFEALKDWKTKKGFRTEIFSTSWIYNKYSGYDNAEKIRNFLKDYYKNNGLIYALLAGDNNLVPERKILYKNPDDQVATDWYYSDLDGTWDANNDHIYGESSKDSIDGYADIIVGRAPVDNIENVKTFVHKDTITEKHPPSNNLKKFLLVSAELQGTSKNYLKDSLANALQDSTTAGWYCSNFLYQKGKHSIVDSLNKGFYLCHIGSHGMVRGFINSTLDDMIFQSNDLPKLNNGNELFILFSMACFVGYFDYKEDDCIGEKLMNLPNGGCIAAVLNSRMGLPIIDSIQNKHILGYSEKICINFNSNFFKRNEFVLGKCHAAARNKYSDYAWKINGGHGHWIYAIAGWNLFGDPDLPMYQEKPLNLVVDHPKNMSNGKQNFTINVKNMTNPVADAFVCCYKGDEVYVTGKTDSEGKVTLSINPLTTGSMYVTVTARNHIPYEGTCTSGNTSISNLAISNKTVLKSISRNTNGKFTVNFSLAQRSDVEVQLINANGVILISNSHRNLSSGIHGINIGNLTPGVNFLKFKTSDCQRIEKIVNFD